MALDLVMYEHHGGGNGVRELIKKTNSRALSPETALQ